MLRMGALHATRVARAFLLILLLLAGLLLAAVLLADRRGRLSRERLGQWWHRRLLAIFNIRLRVRGAAIVTPQLTVANHVSWLDIHVLGSLLPTRFISKSEVRDWPVAGALAEAAGTFYLRRGRGRRPAAVEPCTGGSRPLLEKLVPHLRAGGSVTLFPEGTTTDGARVQPFHARLFGAAIESACHVQPVALRYANGHDGEPVAPFVGEDDLLSHILRLLREPGLDVEVTFCAALSPVDADRDELACAAESAIRRVVEAPKARPVAAIEPATAAATSLPGGA